MYKLFNLKNHETFINFIGIIGLLIILIHFPQWTMFSRQEIIYFILLCVIASNSSIQFKSGMNMTLTAPVAFFCLLALNLNMSIFIGSIGVLSFHVFNKRGFNRTIFNISQYAISVFLTGSFLYLFYQGTLNLPRDFLYIIPTILIFELSNLILVSLALALKLQKPFIGVFTEGIKESQIGLPLYLSNGLIMYICYQTYGLWGLALIIIPLFSVNWLFQANNKANLHKENAYICPTTKLKNKRCLNEWLENDFYNIIKQDQNICFILIDIDDFKKINDRFGHETGDQVLAEFGQLLKNNLRNSDLIYRYGGEEFVIILPTYSQESARIVIERLRKTIQNHTFCDGKLKITFSAGIATLESSLLNDINLNTASELIRRADMAMYSAKQAGKNQIQFFKH